jgi:hypothetical protein
MPETSIGPSLDCRIGSADEPGRNRSRHSRFLGCQPTRIRSPEATCRWGAWCRRPVKHQGFAGASSEQRWSEPGRRNGLEMATSDNEAVVRRHFEEVSVAPARPCPGRGARTSLCRPHGSEGAVVGCPGLSEWFGCSTRHSDLMATVKESSRRTIEWPSGPGRGGSSAWIASTSSWTGDDRTTMSVRQGGAHARPANRLYTCIVSVTCVRSTERTIGHPRT